MKPIIVRISVALMVVFILGFVCKINWNKNVINSDGDGYYIYLPAFIIYKDINFTKKNTISAEYNKRIEQSYFARDVEGKKIDQFTCGVAVLWLPFFATAHVAAKLFSVPDGYSFFYQYAIAFATLVYLMLGFLYLFKLFDTYGFSKLTKYLIAAGILLGTNLFHYAFFEPSMSHVYSFAFITIFLFTVRGYFIGRKASNLWISLLMLAFIVLIRPFNIIIVILIPFLADDFAQLRNALREMFSKHFKSLSAGIFMFLVVISVQSVIWYLQTGHWVVDSYKNQGFDFSEPHILKVLFGFRKGLFIYTPLLLLSVAGLLVLFRQNKFRFFVLIFFMAVLVYSVSSWWSWWYGMSYGHRAFIDYYAVFALLMALWFEHLKRKTSRIVVTVVILLCVLLNQFQAFQYRNYILHWDLMTALKYIAVFGQTSNTDQNNLWKPLNNEKQLPADIRRYFVSENDLENIYAHWDNSSSFINSTCQLPSGELCVKTDAYFTTTPVYTRNLVDVSADSTAKLVIIYKAYFKEKLNGTNPDITFDVQLDSAQIALQKFQSAVSISDGDSEWKLIIGTAEVEVKNTASKTLRARFVANDGKVRWFDDFFAVVYCKP
jgi:hypothetical protein